MNFIAFFIVFFFAQNLYGQQPKISSFSPETGGIGTLVTISGSGFSSLPASNIVYFGAVKALVSAAAETSLTVEVPFGATYQPISVSVNNLIAYSSKPFAVTFVGTGAFNASSFATPVTYVSGKYANMGGIGDFDGDGKPDIISVNYTDDSIAIFQNISSNNTISFAKKLGFLAGDGPGDISIEDLDGDGKLDFIVSNEISKTVSIFRNTSNNGTISFTPKVDFPGFTNTIKVSIGDFDGDGKPDIAEVNNLSGDIFIYRNTCTTGTISFTKVEPSLGFGEILSDISIGDFDKDGMPDLAVTEYSSSSLILLKNISSNGNILFDYQLTLDTKYQPNQISMGDIDGNGNPDLLICSSGSDSITVFRNISTPGNFSFIPFNFKAGTSPNYVSIGDLDGDGKPDLAVSNSETEVKVLKNISAGGTIAFADPVGYFVMGSSNFTSIGDLNADGKPDLIAGSYMSIFILKNQLITVGINKYNSAQDIIVYPNPGTGIYTINSAKIIESAIIIGSKGNIITTYQPKSKQFRIDITDQPSGVYLLSLNHGNNLRTVQLIKL